MSETTTQSSYRWVITYNAPPRNFTIDGETPLTRLQLEELRDEINQARASEQPGGSVRGAGVRLRSR